MKRLEKALKRLAILLIGILIFYTSQAQVLNSDGGFESDPWQNHWARDTYTPCSASQYKVEIVNTRSRSGNRSLHVEHTTCYRNELNTEPYDIGKLAWGKEYWIGFSVYLEDWANNPADWNSLVQCRPMPGNMNWSCDPGINGFTLYTDNWTKNNEIKFHAEIHKDPMNTVPVGGAIGGTAWQAPAPNNKWTDFVINLKFSTGSDGFIKLWANGELVVNLKGPNILYRDQCGKPREPWMFLKFGSYKAYEHKTRRSVYYDDIKIAGGNSNYNDVAPGGAQGNVNSPPSINITNPLPDYIFYANTDIDVEVDAGDPDGNLAKVAYFLNGTLVEEASKPPYSITIPGKEPGTWQLVAVATDSENDQSSDTVRFFTNLTPELTLIQPLQDTTVSAGDDVIIRVNATDVGGEISLVSFYLDSVLVGEINKGPFEYLIENIQGGDHIVTVVAQDNQGLTASVETYIFTNSPPRISFLTPLENEVFDPDDTIEIEADVVDPDDNISTVFFYANDSVIADFVSAPYTTSLQGLDPGPVRLAAVVEDDFGIKDSVSIEILINQKPEISLVQPKQDTTIIKGDDFLFWITANDPDGTLSGVSFYIDSILVSNTNTDPYQYLIENAENGTYILTATATDDMGLTASVSIELFVNTSPEITISSPLDAEILSSDSPVHLSVAAIDPDGNLSKVSLYLNDSLVAEASESTFDYTVDNLNLGTWTFKAIAEDALGLTDIDSITFTRSAPPDLSFIRPVQDTIVSAGDDVWIKLEASDSDGSVASVAIYMDSVLLSTISNGPFEYLLQNILNGNHTISAVATDDLGLTASASLTVFANANPVLAIKSPSENQVFSTGTPVEATVNVSDPDNNLAAVSYFINGSMVAETTQAPFSAVFGDLAPGTWQLVAVAVDAYDAQATDTVSFIVNQPPTISFAQPANNAVFAQGDDVLVLTNPSDEDGYVASVSFYMDSVLLSQTTAVPYQYTIQNIPWGTHTITVVVTDDLGLISVQSVEIFANAISQISIDSPLQNQVFRTDKVIDVKVSVTDPDNNLTKISYFLNDSLVVEITSAPFTTKLAGLGPGTWQLVAVAVDAYDAQATDTVSFIVNQPPTISFAQPANGAVVARGDDVLVLTNPSDEGGSVASVSFYMDSVLLGQAAAAPYQYTIQNIARGNHTITAVVTDDLGLTASASLTVFANANPVITIKSPSENQVFSTGTPVAATVNVSDPDNNLAAVSYFINGSMAAETSQAPFSAVFNDLAPGTWQLVAVAVDAYDAQATDTVSFIVNQPPAISFAQPANGAVVARGDDVLVLTNPSDEGGSVASVSFYMDSVLLGQAAAAPYQYTIQNIARGNHTITAVVTDNHGLTASASLTVFANANPVITIKSPSENQVFSTGTPVAATVNVSDPDNNLAAVSYFIDGSMVAETSQVPFSAVFSDLAPGTWQLVAVAVDAYDAQATDTVSFIVNQPPTISFAQPANGAVVARGDDVLVLTNPSDEGGSVASVSFYMDSVLLGQAAAAPYQYTIQNIARGNHTITAVVTDDLGLTASASLTVFANANPVITIKSPSENQVFSTGTPVAATVNVSDPDNNLAAVSYFINGSMVAETSQVPFSAVFSDLAPGTWQLVAVAVDVYDAQATDTVSFIVNQPPTISFAQPANGAVVARGDDVFVLTNPGDEGGSVASVSFYMDSVLLGQAAAAPYQYTIQNIANGSHTITAVVTDDLGLTASASLTVFANADPVIAINSPSGNQVFSTGTPVEARVTVSDPDNNLAAVSYFIDGSMVAETSQAPFSAVFSNLAPGTWQLVAVAVDVYDAQATDTVSFIVNQPPTISFAQPANGAVVARGDDVLVLTNPGDEGGSVASVSFYMDSVLLGQATSAPYQYTIQNIANGNHTITAVVTDDLGLTASASLTVFANANPVIAINSPSGNQVFSTGTPVEARVTVSDPDNNLAAVSYFIDGSMVAETSQAPFSAVFSNLAPGTWQLVAVAVDAYDAQATDTVSFIVNQPPTISFAQPANGAVVARGDDVLVLTNPSDEGGSVASVSFYMDSVLLGQATSAPYQYTIQNIANGNHTITAVVTDDLGLTASASLTVFANADPQISIAIPVNEWVYRSGFPIIVQSNVTDPDGNLSTVKYFLNGSLHDEVSSMPYSSILGGLDPGLWELIAVATDALDATASDTITFYINEPPVISFLEPLPGAVVSINGDLLVKIDAFDPGGAINEVKLYLDGWRLADLTGGNFEYTIQDLPEGTHVLSAVATDDLGLSTGTSVTFSTNGPPEITIIEPIENQVINSGVPFEIQVETSDNDNNIAKVTYSISGQPDTETSMPPYNASIPGLVGGEYTIIAKVTDEHNESHSDTVHILINATPVADAGPDQEVQLPIETVQLSGTATDTDGSLATTNWAQVSGPSLATIANAENQSTTLTNLVAGTYVFRLEVTDDLGATGSDEVSITVLEEAPNMIPLANAGADINITLPVNHVTLNGSGTDQDGSIEAILWSQMDGPSVAAMLNGDTYTPTLGDLEEGIYVIKLMITDNKGDTATDMIEVTVLSEIDENGQSPLKLDANKYFSPDGNGINDEWGISNLDEFIQPELYVYNRAGQLVYESKNYSNNWNGTMNGGSPLPDGDYYYIFKAKNIVDPFTGAIRIIRVFQ